MSDDRRRLRLVGLSLAGVGFLAPLLASTLRNGGTAVVTRSPGVVVATLLVFVGVVSSSGRRHLDWELPPWVPGGTWVLAGLSLVSHAVSLGLAVVTVGLVGAAVAVGSTRGSGRS
ncbi:MAG: hypothetical protein J07HB67_00021 [halophilic archaeon J07HB67]|jgi:hypothetical protein|nr:MAG: hypothetical protein J07HB67_00021 [halophilic archaeon J07HB67]